MTPRFLLPFLLLGLFAGSGQAASYEPWIDAVISVPTPADASQAEILVLLDERTQQIDAQGVLSSTHRRVIRVLSEKGRDQAFGEVYYDSKVDKVKTLHSWLIHSGGKKETRNGNDWVDFSTDEALTLATDMRKRRVSFSTEVVAGDIFAFETKVVGPALEAVLHYRFGNSFPVITEKWTVSVPAGFSITPKGAGPRAPQEDRSASGDSWTWTLSNMPYRPDEAHMTADPCVDYDLVVRVDPPAGAANFRSKHFNTWGEVTSWLETLDMGQCDTNPALRAKALELTAGCQDALSKIRALAGYVQKTRYISNDEGLGKGMGYVPRKASLVFSRGFGDCKDKANLLRSMLREVGITSYPVIVSTEGENSVRSEIPSVGYFNHAISAVLVDDSVQLPAVVRVDKVGRLLIFDPTDTYTSVGDLPSYLQGTLAHIEAPGVNSLVRLPDIPAEQGFKMSREALLRIEDHSVLKLSCKLDGVGQIASEMRRTITAKRSEKEVDLYLLDMLGDKLHAGVLSKRSLDDRPDQNRYSVVFETSARDFMQHASGGLMILRLDVMGRSYIPVFPEKQRRLAIQMSSYVQDDKITFFVPEDLEVSELPRATSVEHEYGSYKQTVTYENGTVTLHRSLIIPKAEIPASDYAKLKDFLALLARADRCSLLLKWRPVPVPAK
jgi:transglutaminase-like putative cysteine protease